MGRLTVGRARRFWGEIRPPGDKSITHRAYMLSAIAEKGGVIRRPLGAEDCENTLQVLRDVGASVNRTLLGPLETEVRIASSSLRSPEGALWCGNSGTTMRLTAGILAGSKLEAELIGDDSLSRRPMGRIVEPLLQMGADIEGETPPIRIRPADLHGIHYESPVASAQVKSAVLLAGLFASGKTSVTEPALSRDHTERMLAAAGCGVARTGLTVTVEPGRPRHIEMTVPADISSGAFFLVAAALLGGPLTLREVGTNPTRTGLLDVLREAGVQVEQVPRAEEQGEPVADLIVLSSKEALQPFTISGGLVPRLLDEIPVLAVLATQCEGTTEVRDARELRLKESDRIERMATGLRAMGATVETCEDGMAITGPTPLRGARIAAESDHRVAMAFAIAGLIADGETVIESAETIETSFPGFESELRRLAHAD